jgi:hypothetical protein
MSSIDTTGTPSLADVLSVLKSLNPGSFSDPDQLKFFEEVRSMLPALRQSKVSLEGAQSGPESAEVDVIEDDDFPVFDDQKYQRNLRGRWMSSETPEDCENLALEGYRVYWELGASTALPDGVIKNLSACGIQVTAKAGWQTYLQELNCPRKD